MTTFPSPRDTLAPASIGCETLECSIGERFDVVAAVCDRRVAIATPRGEISYGDLAAFADRIADVIGPRRCPVATLLPQGIDAIAAQLGILKAGACYVPLDPRDPGARLRETVGHAHAVTARFRPGAEPARG